jgi:DNA polymerase III gamma/tau subunit
MESLWIENRRNAIGIETDPARALVWVFEIAIAFSRDLLLKGTPMAQSESALFRVTPASLSGLAVIFLLLAALFALLNAQKVKALRANVATPHASVTAKVNASTGATTEAQQQGKTADTDRAVKAEAAIAQAEKEKTDLKGKLDAGEQEIAALRQRAAGMQTNSNASTSGASAPAGNAQSPDLQSQVDDLRRQLDGAEKEKALLAEKLQDAQERPVKEAPKAGTRKTRETASVQRQVSSSHRAGVRGTVLAYNQAYNFVVLNLGARNGVEPNSEMLVLRDGTLIGKIRISSVEPATAIGDIMSNSLARGVQVQPGDSVIYAGTNP